MTENKILLTREDINLIISFLRDKELLPAAPAPFFLNLFNKVNEVLKNKQLNKMSEPLKNSSKKEVVLVLPDKSELCRKKYDEFISMWNENCGNLLKVMGLTSKREALIENALLKNSDLNYWSNVLARVRVSKFCNGFNKQRWRADFEWFLKEDNHIFIMEGKYDNKKDPKKTYVENTKRNI